MEPTKKNPQYLRALADQVTQFRESLDALLSICVYTSRLPLPTDLPPEVFAGYQSLPAITPDMHISEDRWMAAKARVSRAAGRIAHVPEITGVKVSVVGAGRINPFEQWITITQPHSLLSPDDVMFGCEHTLGRLEAMAEEAESAIGSEISIERIHQRVWEAARR